jgi:hypothetical protein
MRRLVPDGPVSIGASHPHGRGARGQANSCGRFSRHGVAPERQRLEVRYISLGAVETHAPRFAVDAYLNDVGITNRLQPDEITNLCNTALEPNDTPGPVGLSER